MGNYTNCPKCNGLDISQEDCGYSSFNVGTIRCVCGFELKTTCSCYPQDELISYWNKTVAVLNEIAQLDQKKMIELAQALYLEDVVIGNSTLMNIVGPAPKTLCKSCAGHGTIVIKQGFHNPPPETCESCKGTGYI